MDYYHWLLYLFIFGKEDFESKYKISVVMYLIFNHRYLYIRGNRHDPTEIL